VDLIAQVLFATDTPAPDAEDAGDDGPETLFPEGKIGGADGTRTPSVSEEKRERFTPSSEAPLVTRDLLRDGVAGEQSPKEEQVLWELAGWTGLGLRASARRNESASLRRVKRLS
jgi:hypothetical protein